MKKILLLVIVLLCAVNSYAQPNLEWVKGMEGSGSHNDFGKAMAVDAFGNVYITGSFEGVVDFDPGAGVSPLTSFGGTGDVFILKLDPSGDLIWAKQVGGSGLDEGTALKVDALGNIYVAGYFYGTSDFDPGLGTNNLVAANTFNSFILKLDVSGDFVWAKQFEGTSNNYVYGLSLDENDNIYTTGTFFETVDFDPGIGTNNLVSVGLGDIFISKLTSSGNFVWVKQMGGLLDEGAKAIVLDASSNIYTTGFFSGTVDFDPGTGSNTLMTVSQDLNADIFVLKLDASGNFVWAKGIGGLYGERGEAIDVDEFGNVFTTGNFVDVVDFDPDGGQYNMTAIGDDAFILKLNASGSFVWARQLGGDVNQYGFAIKAGASGEVYTAGTFFSTVDFDPGVGTYNVDAVGGYDFYILKLDASGEFLWAEQVGGIEAEFCNALVVDIAGNIYTTGGYRNTVDFDPGIGDVSLTSGGAMDIFIHKMKEYISTQIKEETNGQDYFSLYPNPVLHTLYVEIPSPELYERLEVYNSSGVMVRSQPLLVNKNSLEMEGLTSGLYRIKLIGDKGVPQSKTIVKK